MKSNFDIYYNDDAERDCVVSTSTFSGKRVPVEPDYARERIAFLDEEIKRVNECINRVELDIETHKNESIKRGITHVLDEEIREARREKRELGLISEYDYKNAKAVVRGGFFGSAVVGVIGFMMSGLGALPLYMVTGLIGGGVLSLFANDSNAIFKGLRKIYLNYKQFVYRTIRGICAKKREKRFYTLHSYHKLEDELKELRYDREDLVSERDMLKRELDLYYRDSKKGNGCHNAYRFDGNRNGYEYGFGNDKRGMHENYGYNNGSNGKVRRR